MTACVELEKSEGASMCIKKPAGVACVKCRSLNSEKNPSNLCASCKRGDGIGSVCLSDSDESDLLVVNSAEVKKCCILCRQRICCAL